MRVLRPTSGEGQKILLASAISQIPSALNIHYANVLYFGVVCPESHLILCPSVFCEFWV